MIFASINSTESFSLFWIALIASFGAFVVLAGVAMEVFWERHWYKSVSDFRRAESIRIWGGRLVVAGLVWEVIFGAGLAIKEDVDARKIAAEIAKNDPSSQPIRAITAQVFLEIRGTNFDESILSQSEPRGCAFVCFFNKKTWLANLGCEKYISFPIRLPELSDPSDRNPNERIYSMSFNWGSDIVGNPSPQRGDWVARNNASLEQLEKEMVGMDIGVPGMKGGMKIVRGSCVVLFNGSIQREFSIPEYTSNLVLECFPTKN